MAKLSLRAKIILVTVIVIVFFGSLACFFVFFYSRNNFLKNEKESIQALALAQAEVGRAVFDQSSKLLETLVAKDYIINYLQTEPALQDELILAKLESYNVNNNYLAIYLLNTEGDTLVSTDPSFVDKNYAFREYFQRALKKEPYLDVVVGVTSGQFGYYFSRGVLDEQGKVIGVLVAKLDPLIVESAVHLHTAANSKWSNIFLVDKFGVVIYSTKKETIFHSLGKLTSETKRLLIASKRFNDKEIPALAYDEAQKSILDLNQSYKVETLQFYDDLDKEEEVVALAKIPDYPFFILIEENLEGLLNSAYVISWNLAIFVALAAFFAILGIFIFVRNFLKPLSVLQAALVRVAQGDFEQRIVISSSDELEQLGDSFNNLVEQLKKNREVIEAKVQEKTKNLERLNKNTVDRELQMIALKKELNDLKNKK